MEQDGRFYNPSGITLDITEDFLADAGTEKVRADLFAQTLPEFGGARDLREGSPFAGPGAVICVGKNYATHAIESGENPPITPISFFKHPM